MKLRFTIVGYYISFLSLRNFFAFLVCLLDEGIKAVVVFVMNFQTFCLGGTVVHLYSLIL